MRGILRRLLKRGGKTPGLSLDEYALVLETSHWQAPLEPTLTRARVPQLLPKLKGIKAVIWDVYGTLLYCTHDGESRRFLEERPAVALAFERTIQHFRMWPAMSRSRLAPGEYLWKQFRELAGQVLVEKNLRGSDHPEIKLEQVWQRLLVRLGKGGFTYDPAVVGPAPAFAQKIALFCDETLQRTALFPGALEAVQALNERGIRQGVACDGQVYTNAQLVKGLARAGGPAALGTLFDPMFFSYSYEVSVTRPNAAVYRALARRLAERGITPSEALVVGNDAMHDVMVPASVGFRAALFAGSADTVRLREGEADLNRCRPDAILVEIGQVNDIIA